MIRPVSVLILAVALARAVVAQPAPTGSAPGPGEGAASPNQSVFGELFERVGEALPAPAWEGSMRRVNPVEVSGQFTPEERRVADPLFARLVAGEMLVASIPSEKRLCAVQALRFADAESARAYHAFIQRVSRDQIASIGKTTSPGFTEVTDVAVPREGVDRATVLTISQTDGTLPGVTSYGRAFRGPVYVEVMTFRPIGAESVFQAVFDAAAGTLSR